MTVTLSPSSRRPEAVEPVLIPRDPLPAGGRLPRNGRTEQYNPPARERLLPGTPVPPPPGYRKLRPMISGLIRPDTVETPGPGRAIAISGLLHAALLAAILIESAHHSQHGTPDATRTEPQVEMVFSPPTSSGLQGQSSPDMAGGQNAPKQQQDKQPSPSAQQNTNSPQHNSEDSSPSANAPSEDTPSAPPLSEAPSDLSVPQSQQQDKFNPAMQNSGHGSHAAQQSQSQSSPNAYAALQHPMNWSLSASPLPRRSRQGRAGGTGGPIDLSLGPVVQNGKINAPYSTSTQIKGVSDDYGEELERWIRSHMYYPMEAAQAGEEGPSSVHVELDRDGHVKKVRLTGQSGSYYLDAATTGMFRNAQLPPVPPDMQGDTFPIDLTINYILIRR
ncbi:energy transducer TonB [Komagataeibacter xylinus]|uniref:Energy transducer TonB n=1 Tax=Komagataeibacter xylinus TaxID=28448 RepID=A0A318PH84_KOMXY|nr:energy transducer TonB [Komagataeibacter xylinus]AZV39393.1 energy transducer TonB [Komagataeibacter xylinus]PYD56620.1 energy transducer TonB [Komagataeibacter xylinus]GBQ81908.1 TonB periplasmic protein [Komagataeibacter xylinus NBRC 15237]